MSAPDKDATAPTPGREAPSGALLARCRCGTEYNTRLTDAVAYSRAVGEAGWRFVWNRSRFSYSLECPSCARLDAQSCAAA